MTQEERRPYRELARIVKDQIKLLLDKDDKEFHFGDMLEVESRASLLRHLLPYTLEERIIASKLADGLSYGFHTPTTDAVSTGL